MTPLVQEMEFRESQLKASAISSLADAISKVASDEPDEAVFEVARLNLSAWLASRSATEHARFLDQTGGHA